eukprot:gene3769-4027_t
MNSTQLNKVLILLQETGSFSKLLQKFHNELIADGVTVKNLLCILLIDEALQNHEWLDVDSLDFYQEISRLPITPQDLEYLRKANNIYQTEISTLLPIDQTPRKAWTELELTEEFQAITAIQNDFQSCTLKLDLVTLVPPVMEIGDDELEFLDFEEDEDLLWTPIKRFFQVSNQRYSELQQKSITAPLSPEDTHEYLYALKQTPSYISKYPFTVEQTSQLLSHNWSLIIEIVLFLHSLPQQEVATNGSSTANHTSKPSSEPSLLSLFISSFLQMEITTQALETLHAICKKVDLPLEFVQKYLLQCMEFCSKNKESRYVRLVCGLIQSILKKNPKPISTVIVELQSFCLSFTNVKDAIILYAMAKGIDSK